ncbi:amidase signature domain-containing protein [Fusarium flagelliforme]|uniref:amidase signature domain-containing protein n=1 Tax=Fusarium flagelliforme TaxID=2675880 RepID=UPI001E8E9690|nr:amidase signature domain-containing protein [Fusarium flagelliforme]KAH7198998.1 amidase signature domain-containing protein [Fusarium flagelliforme]
MTNQPTIKLLEASISDLKQLLDKRTITSVELVALYLHRIGKYDCRGPRLNSVCSINPGVFAEAQASDDYRASGKQPRPLEGIPFTVKDSYKVKGMTVAAASPAFADLQATSDAAIVELLRNAGAVVLGKTNMPPMADGGCQRGLYGRSESPYNQKYMCTAYASGSSYGCGVSTAASLAAFGFAGEAVTSGRSPASNNALVAYAPSRSMISPRGLWPLYPTCDQVVPHTRTMMDLFHVLNVVAADDDKAGDSDFWRSQPFVPLPRVSEVRPADYLTLANPNALQGRRLAVPRCFIGVEGAKPDNACSPGVKALWERARADLERLGATVIETDFPLFENYTRQDFAGQSMNVPNLSQEWAALERCEIIALSWDDFLRGNGDKDIPGFLSVELDKIHPHIAPMDDPSQHTESQNQVRYEDMVAAVKNRGDSRLIDLPGCKDALQALEAMRKKDLEDWMIENNYDAVVFPTNGDVALTDADENYESMISALRDGVKYANGGRSLKHLGVPCITVPMGNLEEEKMPVGLSFCGKAYDDSTLMSYAYAYETASNRREAPPLAPLLPSDDISVADSKPQPPTLMTPVLTVTFTTAVEEDDPNSDVRVVKVTGACHLGISTGEGVSLKVFANGEPTNAVSWEGSNWVWTGRLTRPKSTDTYPALAKVPRDQFLIVLIAKADNGRSAGSFMLID